MTDGRFFSQFSCQETQKAWMHHHNGEIRPGRHPRRIWEPFPQFHEDSGQSWWCLFSGRLTGGNETKMDPQKKLPPWYHQLLNLGMDAIVAMALLFQNLKIDLEGFFRGGGGEHLEDHLVNLGGRTDLGAHVLLGLFWLGRQPWPFTLSPTDNRTSFHCYSWKWKEVFDLVTFRNFILFTTGLLAFGQHRQLPRCPSWEHWPQ